MNTVGKAVVAVLRSPAETANRYIYVRSVTTSQNEILAAMQEATGKTWDVTRTTTDVEVETGKEMIANGNMTGNFALVLASTYGKIEGLRANYEMDEVLGNEMLGLETESVAATIAAVLGA